MEIAPRYDAAPAIELDGPDDDQQHTVTRQRRRFEAALAALDDGQWRAPSRCEGWSVQDVVSHLTTVNGFWSASLAAGLAGEPTRILAGFDPKATPELLVAGTRAQPPAEALAAFSASNVQLCAQVDALAASDWNVIAESPAGHEPLRVVLLHALWDSWIHERDVLLPLGLPVVEEEDEVLSCLRYVSSIGAAFAVSNDPARAGTLVIEATDPAAQVVVDVRDGVVRVRDGGAPDGAPVLRGRAVDLVEGLSMRAPLPAGAEASRWMIDALADVFEVSPT